MNSKPDFQNWWYGQANKLLAVQTVTLALCLIGLNSLAQPYRVLHEFDGSDGGCPLGNLVISGATLYGTTVFGGSSNYGTVFKLDTDGNNFTTLKSFAGRRDGGNPNSGLTPAGSTLFGTTSQFQNDWGAGTVFRLDTNGSGYEIIAQLGVPNGWNPVGGLLLSEATLYGTTWGGVGSNLYGAVFKIQTNGTGCTILKYFTTGTNGANPKARLVLSGTTLYGTAAEGGLTNAKYPYGCGTVFSIKTDGSGFRVLKYFDGSDGVFPGDLVLSGNTLYGVTGWPGNGTNYGILFRLNTDGSGFSIIKRFGRGDEQSPACLLLSGDTLYGVTGGLYQWSAYGTIFRIQTNGSDYTVLKQFAGSDGACPGNSLLLLDGILFGTTRYGGSFGQGVVFSMGIKPPAILSSPPNQTAEAGSTVDFAFGLDGSLPMMCRWLFDGTNLVGYSTNCWLELTNCDFSQSGTYTVVVTNVSGAVTSAPAMLNVIPVVERRPVPAINLLGEAGTLLNVEYTDALGPTANWLPFDSVNLTNPPQFWFDLTEPLPPQRFYRVWQAGTPSIVPSPDLHIVPAITLTGNVGDSLRLDYINAIGPTDAWVNLDTVTLTNTSQLYFDTSSIGQPRRLYRIVPEP